MELEQDLTENNFSKDSVRCFLGVLTSWLVYHIMNSDQAIVGKHKDIDRDSGAVTLMEKLMSEAMEEMFQLPLETDSDYYSGGFAGGEIFCEALCVTEQGETVRVLTAGDELFAVHMARTMLQIEISQADELVRSAVKELSSLLSIRFAQNLRDGKVYRVENIRFISQDEAERERENEALLISLLFTSPAGNLVVRAWEK